MASFLFGLKDNSIAKKAKVNDKKIDFSHILQDDEKVQDSIYLVLYRHNLSYSPNSES